MEGKKQVKTYEDLDVFRKADNFVIEIYKITKNYPKEEQFSLISQMRRSVISIPANIVEGFNRQHTKEYIQFLQIALGSLAETEYYIKLSRRLEYLENKSAIQLIEQASEIGRMLRGLINSLKNKQFTKC